MKKAALACCLVLVTPFLYAQTDRYSPPKISAVGMGTMTAFPDAAQITIAFKHVKPTLREAVDENQKTADQVKAIVQKYVSDTLDIKTSLISTGKSTRWDDKTNRDVFLGFESTQKLIFTLKELKRMQDFTEELLKTKFYKIERISYFNTEAQDYLKRAQELAVLDAMDTTTRLAKVSHVNTGKIIYMESNKSPNDNAGNRVSSYDFESYGKGMGGRGVASSGELIKYSVQVTLFTEITD